MIVKDASTEESRGFCHVCKDSPSQLCIDTPYIIVRLCMKCAASVAEEITRFTNPPARKFTTNIGTKGGA